MTKMTFETVSEYLDDRYTPAEVVELFDIPMAILVDRLWDYLLEEREEQVLELLTEHEDEEWEQLELEF